MDNETTKILAEKYKGLPEALQQAISSADLPPIIQSISQKNALHLDQAGALETEITLVLLGVENYSTFAGNLEREMHITPELAGQIAKEVDDLVFRKVKRFLIDLTLPQKESSDAELDKNIENVTGLELNKTENNPIPVVEVENQEKASGFVLPIKPKSITDDFQVIKSNSVKVEPNFTADKLKNINVSRSEKISLAPKTENKTKITDPYLEPIE
jgi:hypothetical protein